MKPLIRTLLGAVFVATSAIASTPQMPAVTAVSSSTVEVHQPQLKFGYGARRLSGCASPRRGAYARAATHLDVVALDAAGARLTSTEVPLKAWARRFRPRAPRPHARFELSLDVVFNRHRPHRGADARQNDSPTLIPTMKTEVLMFVATLFLAAAAARGENAVAGPTGGRLLETEPARAEFVVNAARKAEIRFYDTALKPTAPAAQVVTVTAEPASGRVKLEVEKTAFGFATKEALPAGDPYRVVVQVRATVEAKPQNFRLDLTLGNCAGCQRAEYACTCESH